MISLSDLKRLMKPVTNKISLMVGRAILKAVNNAEQTQKLQVLALKGETISRMERFQEYGFETFPPEESEVAAIFLNGNRDRGIALCVHNRGARLTDLVEGEVAMYTSEDALTGGHRIHLKSGQVIDILGGGDIKIESRGDVYINSKKGDVNVTTVNVNVTAANVKVVATVRAIVDSPAVELGNGGAPALEKLMNKVAMDRFNSHFHTYNGGPNLNQNSSAPTVVMVENTDTTKDTTAS